MEQQKSKKPLEPAKIAKIKAYLGDTPIHAFSRAVGVNPGSLTRALAGFALYPATRLFIETQFDQYTETGKCEICSCFAVIKPGPTRLIKTPDCFRVEDARHIGKIERDMCEACEDCFQTYGQPKKFVELYNSLKSTNPPEAL